jgi:GT2 family glycosyltransferase/peptidoglycan/xylan/chitin deacetylase (PgdA/CDA1 family)
MNWPSFSIVVPTFQRRDVVCASVRALCEIDYPGEIELIVIIDGSKDGTEAALKEITYPFPSRIIYQENTGLAGARNRGANEAANDIILFLDDDMVCRPDIVTEHAKSLMDGADAVLGHIPLDPNSTPGFLSKGVGDWADKRAERLAGGAELTLFDLIGGQMALRRSVFEQVGGFDHSFTAGGSYGDEDLDMGTRLAKDFDVRFNPQAISFQRYVVTPAQHMEQWYQAGQADVVFARKHPERARELFELHGSRTARARYLLRPLASLPLASAILSAIAIWFADREHQLPRFSRRRMAWFYYTSRGVRYWKGVRHAGGIPASKQALVLCYHAIADLKDDPVLREYGIPPDKFARQLDSLRAAGFTFTSPDEIANLLTDEAPIPSKAMLLTFDDCYEELPGIAEKMLGPRGIPAIAFAVSGMESDTNEWDQAIGAGTMQLLDGEGLNRLACHRVEIGCHSRTHRPLPKLSEAELAEETSGAAGDIAALGLPRPRFFAYPHGEQNERSRAAVKAAGFTAAFGLTACEMTPSSDPFDVPRVEILASDGPFKFWLKTRWPRLSVHLIRGPGSARARLGRKVRRVLRGGISHPQQERAA